MRKSALMFIPALLAACIVCAEEAVKLPAPVKTGGMPLMEALANRKSNRRTAGAKPTLQQLSNLLWAANGVTRPDGKRTAPSAMNKQEIELAVLTAEGLFTYDPLANTLTPTPACVDLTDQLRGASAFVILHYNSANQTRENALVDAGFVGQNLYLYCTSQGWPTVFLGSIDRGKLSQALGCNEKEVLYAQRIGIQ